MTAIATGTPTVTLIVSIYQDVLGARDLDGESDFFENGGDSLTAFQITDRLEQALGAEVAVALVFAYPSPSELAAVVDADLGRS